MTRTTLILGVTVVLVAACGGGGPPGEQPATLASASAAGPPRSDLRRTLAGGSGEVRAASAAPAAPTNWQLFRGAEAIFPDLFPAAPVPGRIENVRHGGRIFEAKAYANGNYLGISSTGDVWGLGPYTDGQLVNLGAVQSYAGLVCAHIDCNDGRTAALNGCTIGASAALRSGYRSTARYRSSLLVAPHSVTEFETDQTVEGPGTFEGQSATKVRDRSRGTQYGTSYDTNILSYLQVAEGDLMRIIGAEASGVFAGHIGSMRVVFDPPGLYSEFTLVPGGTLIKTMITTTTISSPSLPVQRPQVAESTQTFTFEAREAISVLGRSWETCRYRKNQSGTAETVVDWYLAGNGWHVRSEVRDTADRTLARNELLWIVVDGITL